MKIGRRTGPSQQLRKINTEWKLAAELSRVWKMREKSTEWKLADEPSRVKQLW